MTLSKNLACNPVCGTCHYKDLEYDFQIARKMAWAEKCLGKWKAVLKPIRVAPEDERLGYREKTWMRSEVHGQRIDFGFYKAFSDGAKWSKKMVSLATCPIHHPSIAMTLERLKPVFLKSRYAHDSLFGVWFGLPDLVLVGKDPLPRDLENFDWAGVLPKEIERVGFYQTSQVGKTVFSGGSVAPLYSVRESGAPSLDQSVRAFRQVARTLVRSAREEARIELLRDRPEAILDLYCGAGELAAGISTSVGWIGIESSREATQIANRVRLAASLHVAYPGFVEDRLRDPEVRKIIPGNYALYLNPPRPGLGSRGRSAVEELLRENPAQVIVYLSCSASSLARDLDLFESHGYQVDRLQPFDFFPHTEHFETLAILKK